MKIRHAVPIIVAVVAIGLIVSNNASKNGSVTKASPVTRYASTSHLASPMSNPAASGVPKITSSPLPTVRVTGAPTKEPTAIPTSIPRSKEPYGTASAASTPFMTAAPSRTPSPTRAPTRVPAYTTAPKATAASTPIPGTKYVLNRNTKKFHNPSCSEVKRIKDSNRTDYFGTYSEITGMGYVPCKKCNPK